MILNFHISQSSLYFHDFVKINYYIPDIYQKIIVLFYFSDTFSWMKQFVYPKIGWHLDGITFLKLSNKTQVRVVCIRNIQVNIVSVMDNK